MKSRRNTQRLAFTLTELLLVLAGSVLLLGLLVPAAQSARASSHRLKCADNFKRVGEAIYQYAKNNDGLLPTDRAGRGMRATYVTHLLPYLEQEKLARAYRTDLSWSDPANAMAVQTRLPVVQCPETPKPDRWIEGATRGGEDFKAAPMDYITAAQITANPDVASLFPPDLDRTGAWSSSRLSEVGDGLSTTFMGIFEIADKPNRWQAGKLIPSNRMPNGTGTWAADGGNALRGYTWDGSKFPGPCPFNCSNSAAVYSFHPEGSNFLFADGSVRFLNKTMDVWVFYAMVTRNGGEIIASSDF